MASETIHDVTIDTRNGQVLLTAGDYAAGPEHLTPEAALEVAAALISAAREARANPGDARRALAAEYTAQGLDAPGSDIGRVRQTRMRLLDLTDQVFPEDTTLPTKENDL